jgi:hypothetical protein
MYASIHSVLYFTGTLVIALALVVAIVLFADCALCAWRDRRHAHHH